MDIPEYSRTIGWIFLANSDLVSPYQCLQSFRVETSCPKHFRSPILWLLWDFIEVHTCTHWKSRSVMKCACSEMSKVAWFITSYHIHQTSQGSRNKILSSRATFNPPVLQLSCTLKYILCIPKFWWTPSFSWLISNDVTIISQSYSHYSRLYPVFVPHDILIIPLWYPTISHVIPSIVSGCPWSQMNSMASLSTKDQCCIIIFFWGDSLIYNNYIYNYITYPLYPYHSVSHLYSIYIPFLSQ